MSAGLVETHIKATNRWGFNRIEARATRSFGILGTRYLIHGHEGICLRLPFFLPRWGYSRLESPEMGRVSTRVLLPVAAVRQIRRE